MQPEGFIMAAVIGIVAGWLASFVVGRGGLIKYLIWGVIGSYVGTFVIPLTGIEIETGFALLNTVIVSTIGAIILVLVARVVA